MQAIECQGADLADSLVAIQYGTAIVRERWKVEILWLILAGHHRFNALQRALPNTTHKMLSQQLRDLVRDGILRRWSAERGRRHVEYLPTAAGEALRPVLTALEAWAREYKRSSEETAAPRPTATRLELERSVHVAREQSAVTQRSFGPSDALRAPKSAEPLRRQHG